ncbi:hypothetical protein OIO90_005387 [Microbotryomycetes sp. JL221]|nr:hypothetical protein OIO90_005387 [Microbotryomycetes sp. JL221]
MHYQLQRAQLNPSSTSVAQAAMRADLLAFSSPASPESKWCREHEICQAKLLKTYKRCTKAIAAFDIENVLPTVKQASDEDDLDTLRRWSELVRTKMILIHRAQSARAEHHAQFYAGGDANHCMFIDVLQGETDKLENLAQLLEERAYEITLQLSEASWILQAQGETIICDDGPAATLITPPSTPPQSRAELVSSALKPTSKRRQARTRPVDAARRPPTPPPDDSKFWAHLDGPQRVIDEPTELLKKMRAYLKAPDGLPSSISAEIWHDVVSQLFRMVILRSPELAPLVLGKRGGEPPRYTSVEQFLDLLEDRAINSAGNSGVEITKLWRRMKFAKAADAEANGKSKKISGLLGVQTLRDAIADIFRHRGETSNAPENGCVELLGGRVWKTASGLDLPPAGFDILYQFIACPGCVVSITKTFTSLSRHRRLALLGAYPAWLTPGESPAEHIMRLANVVLCSCNRSTCSVKVKRVEQKATKGSKKNVVYTEEWERPWMFVKLPDDDPSTTALLDLLGESSDKFAILAQRSGASEPTYKPLTTSAKPRSSTVFPVDKALNSFANNSSETRHGHRYTDCYDVLIMDNSDYPAAGSSSKSCSGSSSSASWQSFLANVAATILRSRGLVTVMELYNQKLAEAREAGDPVGSVSLEAEREIKDGYVIIEESLVARDMFREE